MSGHIVEIAGQRLPLSNLEKELYPGYGFTKGQVVEYYGQIAECLLPHLRDRALTLKRYPNGVEQPFFFEKRCPVHRPPWVQTAAIRRAGGEQLTACLVNDLTTLLWVANLAALELHVPLARAGSPETPTAMVFDLDPGEGANILDCARVALLLREVLSRLGLVSWVKTSGLKGLHLFVPLNHPATTFAMTKQFTKTVAAILEKNYPDLVTAKMAKEARQGKVFINWSQNDAALTMVCVYSLRAREKPVVSSPLAWPELAQLAGEGDPGKFQITPAEAVRRAEALGDLFRELLSTEQQLPHLQPVAQVPIAVTDLVLKEYAAKRRFGQTPEPEPGQRPGGNQLTFVVHKHAARALHYDIRLELAGVLKSWACPKGPSLDPAVKRLAVMVEDHPLAYQDFEGVIPAGNYGAGSVIIWDRGVYCHPAAKDGQDSEQLLLAGLRKGDLKFVLAGEKLKGEFALVKTGKDDRSWLLLKKRDRYATGEDILTANRSVVTNRTLEEVFTAETGGGSGQKTIGRIRQREALESDVLQAAPVNPMPHLVQPMLATQIAEPFDHPDWLFEVKWDGYRAVAEVRDGEVALYSRNLISLQQKFPPIKAALQKLGVNAVLDGEIVVVDKRGHPAFQLLQDYRESASGQLCYYVFDLLHFQGHDLTDLPLLSRKELLQQILPPLPPIRFSDHVREDGVLFFDVVRQQGLEGIVAKDAHSPYRIGRRSRQWLKVKIQRTQEGVIAGFTAPRGGRRHFGTLVLGAFAGGELVPIGHAGGGFTAKELAEIHARLGPLVQTACPFKVQPPTNAPVTWVRPELVCEVALAGWTADGVMRQPVFKRLREDKQAAEVVRDSGGEGVDS